MKHFQRLASNVDCLPILHQLQRQPELWDENKLRTTYPNSPHREASDILVFFNVLNGIDVANDKEVIPYNAWHRVPALRPLVMALMAQTGAVRLGRVIITRLEPGRQIYEHKDQGAPAEYFERYQVALLSLPGVQFNIADESVGFKSGEIWHINNKETHSVINNSADDRIAMIVDLRIE